MSVGERLKRAGSDEVLLAELVAGKTLKDAAGPAGMSYATARRRFAEEGFQVQLEAARAELREMIVRRLDVAVGRAIARLEILVDEGKTDSAQIAASRALIQHALDNPVRKPEPAAAVEPLAPKPKPAPAKREPKGPPSPRAWLSQESRRQAGLMRKQF